MTKTSLAVLLVVTLACLGAGLAFWLDARRDARQSAAQTALLRAMTLNAHPPQAPAPSRER